MGSPPTAPRTTRGGDWPLGGARPTKWDAAPGPPQKPKAPQKPPPTRHNHPPRLDTLLDHTPRRDVQWFVKAASTLLK